jgi:Uma2 family endonuclease
MTIALNQPGNSTQPTLPRVYAITTIADLLQRLGNIPPERVRMDPTPGNATFDDLVQVNEQHNGPICEWVENTLVEKAMGFNESWLAFIIMGQFDAYLLTHDLGMCTAPDGVMKILPEIGRAPDVSFISWKSLPGGKPPPRSEKVPAVVPELVVEVLSESNTPREMARKRDEYFRAGVKLVWEINPESRSANVFTGPNNIAPVPANGNLSGGDILPGFILSLQQVFDRAERRC